MKQTNREFYCGDYEAGKEAMCSQQCVGCADDT